MIGQIKGVARALQLFKDAGVKAWEPLTKAKNVTVRFEKTGEFNGIPQFNKIVKRKDGSIITGHFSGTYCTGADEVNAMGKISTSFGAQNYDKVTQIIMNDGRYINRLGHKNQPQRFIDCYGDTHKQYDYCQDNGLTFNRLLSEFHGKV